MPKDQTLENKPKKKRTYHRKPKGQPPALVTDAEGMEALTNPEPAKEIVPSPTKESITMDVIPSVGPSLTEPGVPDIVPVETPEPGITMQNTEPRRFTFMRGERKPKEKKTSILTMSNMSSRRK